LYLHVTDVFYTTNRATVYTVEEYNNIGLQGEL